ncbi:hypothetical protein [Kitasatospora sp. LaBMicrA B282]|uniref:hypothetical protein n=1 Tax=Kitasatospora sp. LaBMicrA B282 TaxID=3420949 RepID=UPI003D141831
MSAGVAELLGGGVAGTVDGADGMAGTDGMAGADGLLLAGGLLAAPLCEEPLDPQAVARARTAAPAAATVAARRRCFEIMALPCQEKTDTATG